MKTLIASEKGGTGKSTIATNLAAYLAAAGQDSLLLDTDPQATARNWVQRRSDAHPKLPVVHVAQANGDVMKIVQDMSGRFEQVCVDCGGRDSKEMRTALLAADVLVVPTRASQFDLETLQHMNDLVGLARTINPNLKAYALLNQAPSNRVIDEPREAREFMREFPELELLDVTIYDRKVYRDATAEGLSVIELNNSQARAEIQLLGQALFGELK